MPIRYLLDENLRGPLWRYVTHHNARGIDPIDAVRVGDLGVVPLGTLDPEVLIWCEAHDRILVSHDRNTVPVHLEAHLDAGRHIPGIFLVRDVDLAEVVEFLAIAAGASDAAEWRDRYFYIP